MHAARISTSMEADEIQHSTPIAAADDRNSPSLGSHRGQRRAPFCPVARGIAPPAHPAFPAARYGLAVIFAAAAYFAAILLEVGTGRFSPFPFYAAVVAGAWLGVGPGLLSFVLSSVAAADFWTPARYDIQIAPVDLPSFAAFVVFALMTLAWSVQRRRAQQALEATVRQRTAELVHANAALKAEMAEREATERALRDAEAELARTLRLATMAELAATIAHEINQPLAAITANGSACLRSLQRDPPLLDNAREAASCIVADGHRAGDVIARIRALFSKEPPRQLVLNLNETIQAVLALSRGAIERQRGHRPHRTGRSAAAGSGGSGAAAAGRHQPCHERARSDGRNSRGRARDDRALADRGRNRRGYRRGQRRRLGSRSRCSYLRQLLHDETGRRRRRARDQPFDYRCSWRLDVGQRRARPPAPLSASPCLSRRWSAEPANGRNAP